MNKTISIDAVTLELVGIDQHACIDEFYQAHRENEILSGSAQNLSPLDPLTHDSSAQPRLSLSAEPKQGLTLRWHRSEQKPLSYHLDFVKTAKQLRSFPAPKQGAFNQALGKKTKTVIDATGGWGGDALLMCLQGYQVTIVERQAVMALLLSEAFARLAISDWFIDNGVSAPRVINANAFDVFNQKELNADCVYLDPMFPAKRKKSAAVNKQMQLLHELVGEDADAAEVLAAALDNNFARVAVKRPHYAESLLRSPDTQFSSKLVHYDVYLNTNTHGCS